MSKGKEPSEVARLRRAYEVARDDYNAAKATMDAAETSYWHGMKMLLKDRESALTAARAEAIEAAAKVADARNNYSPIVVVVAREIRALLLAQEQEAEGG